LLHAQPKAAGPKNILVVDDDELVIEVVSMVIEDAGFDVVRAVDYESAMDAVSLHEIGVAIVDKNLPGDHDGLDILRELRRRLPHTPVLMYTGYSSTSSAIEALRAGAFDYLEKPSDNSLIIEKVKRAWAVYELEVARAELFRNYETLFEVIPGIVWFLSDGGIFRRISAQGAALLGYRPDELLGKDYRMVIDEDTADDETHWAFKERRTGDRATQRKPIILKTKAGAERIFEINSAAAYEVAPDGKEQSYGGTLAVGVDITEHMRALEKLQETDKMDALGRLAGGIAHDFNNILSVITISAEFALESDELNDTARKDLDEICAASDRAAKLTKQLLMFSRQQATERKPIRLGPVLENVHTMLSRLIREDVQLDVEIAKDLGTVRADASQIERVVVNLAVNGRDAMPDGGNLAIRAHNVTVDEEYAADNDNLAPGEFVMLAVSDSGKGMSPEVRKHLFEPFFTTKRTGKGTGLGMAIVYGIVRKAGGTLSVYSERGVGTTIRIYLPRIVDRPSDAPSPTVVQGLGGDETVLLVEDKEVVRRLAKRIFESSGYTVIEATDGVDALSAADGAAFDVLVTDIVMPEMGGTQLARELRDARPDLPVLYMSGYIGGFTGTYELLTERAVFLPKPFTREVLLTKVRQLLDAKDR
jgi:PAS domain S-box-containing protein